MNLYKSDKVRFISGLIFIIIIYSWYYISFVEDMNFVSTPKIIVHIIRLSTTIIIYFVGTIHLGKLKDTWMSSIWHLIHISGLCIITSLGLFHWLIAEISDNTIQFVNSIQEILISPVLYVAMGLLNKSNKRGNLS